MRQHVPPEQLWNEFHGDLEFEYDHEVYWPTMLKLCEEKHAEQRERWVKGGKRYGESEDYIKGGNTPSIGLSNAAAEVIAEKKEEGPASVKSDEEEGQKAPVETNGA